MKNDPEEREISLLRGRQYRIILQELIKGRRMRILGLISRKIQGLHDFARL